MQKLLQDVLWTANERDEKSVHQSVKMKRDEIKNYCVMINGASCVIL